MSTDSGALKELAGLLPDKLKPIITGIICLYMGHIVNPLLIPMHSAWVVFPYIVPAWTIFWMIFTMIHGVLTFRNSNSK